MAGFDEIIVTKIYTVFSGAELQNLGRTRFWSAPEVTLVGTYLGHVWGGVRVY